DAVREVFPDLEEIDDPPTRRFRIPGGLDGVFQTPTAEELAALRSAADVLAAGGAAVRADALRVLEHKIMGAVRASARRRIAADGEPRAWRFDRMREVALCERPAAPPAGFSLADYALASFGIYHGEVEDVVLRIAPDRAADALAWRFHPRQSVTQLGDGAVEV